MATLTRARRPTGKRLSPVLLLAATMIIAVTVMRLGQSAGFSFWDDEFTHVFAARNLTAIGRLALPGGAPYTRAWPYTFLVALSFKIFGVSEIAARLPSVLAGAALLAAVFLAVRKYFGDAPALLATALTALDPLTSPLMIISRMYSLFVLIYFIVAVVLFVTVERWRSDRPFIAGAAATLLFAGLAASTHLLSAFLVPGIAVYLLVSGFGDLKAGNRNKALIQLAAACLAVLAVAAFVVKGGSVNRAPAVADLSLWYFPRLLARYALPAAVLAIVGTWRALSTRSRPVIFMASIALGGLFTQAVFFGTWLSPRYMAQYMPFIYILAAVGIFGSGQPHRLHRVPAWQVPAALVLFAATAVLWAGNDLPLSYMNTPDYHLARRLVLPSLKRNRGEVVVSTITLATEHYLGRSDYWLRERRIKFYTKEKSGVQFDTYTGARLVSSSAQLAALMKEKKSGWIILDHRLGNLSPATMGVIKTDSVLVAQDRRRLWVYHWDHRTGD